MQFGFEISLKDRKIGKKKKERKISQLIERRERFHCCGFLSYVPVIMNL